MGDIRGIQSRLRSVFFVVGGVYNSRHSSDSDLIRLNVFGSNILIVNSLAAASDLLDKRSATYSDRYVEQAP